MAVYVIEGTPALQQGVGGYNFQTSIAVSFLTLFKLTGGPNRVGTPLSINRAITNGINALKSNQGPPEAAPVDVCNTGVWNEQSPQADGDAHITVEAVAALTLGEQVQADSSNTLSRVNDFLSRFIAFDQGGLYRGCTQANSVSNSVSSAATLTSLALVGVDVSDVLVRVNATRFKMTILLSIHGVPNSSPKMPRPT